MAFWRLLEMSSGTSDQKKSPSSKSPHSSLRPTSIAGVEMSWGEDSAGVRRLKPTPAGFSIELKDYEKSVGWLKRFLFLNFGLKVKSVTFDAYASLWRAYNYDDEIIVNIDNDLMNRLLLVLEHIEWMLFQGPEQVRAYEEVLDEPFEMMQMKRDEDEDDGA
jgi:hypothetical protein